MSNVNTFDENEHFLTNDQRPLRGGRSTPLRFGPPDNCLPVLFVNSDEWTDNRYQTAFLLISASWIASQRSFGNPRKLPPAVTLIRAAGPRSGRGGILFFCIPFRTQGGRRRAPQPKAAPLTSPPWTQKKGCTPGSTRRTPKIGGSLPPILLPIIVFVTIGATLFRMANASNVSIHDVCSRIT